MNRLLLTLTIALTISINGYAQDCRDPDNRVTFKEKFKEIGVSDPDFLRVATVISYKALSDATKTQWVGLHWGGPVSGALLAYDCGGNLLSIEQTGGIKSIEFFNAPRSARPAVAVEEVFTGTGYYKIQYVIYSLSNGKILKLWDHTRYERNSVQP